MPFLDSNEAASGSPKEGCTRKTKGAKKTTEGEKTTNVMAEPKKVKSCSREADRLINSEEIQDQCDGPEAPRRHQLLKWHSGEMVNELPMRGFCVSSS